MKRPMGSSPRVWGAPQQKQLITQSLRLIPTCVGSTRFTPNALVQSTAHPHVCGEHITGGECARHCLGSSPRVWGAPSRTGWVRDGVRLIPTCVGSTSLVANARAIASAHPHVCGEHRRCPGLPRLYVGSSPRVWGALSAAWVGTTGIRLIPTCVGSTSAKKSFITPSPAHPHVCGEHVWMIQNVLGPVGSSPRVWGARL